MDNRSVRKRKRAPLIEEIVSAIEELQCLEHEMVDFEYRIDDLSNELDELGITKTEIKKNRLQSYFPW